SVAAGGTRRLSEKCRFWKLTWAPSRSTNFGQFQRRGRRIRPCGARRLFGGELDRKSCARPPWDRHGGLLRREQPQEIVCQTNQCPLALHFCLSPYQELTKSACLLDLSE